MGARRSGRKGAESGEKKAVKRAFAGCIFLPLRLKFFSSSTIEIAAADEHQFTSYDLTGAGSAGLQSRPPPLAVARL